MFWGLWHADSSLGDALPASGHIVIYVLKAMQLCPKHVTLYPSVLINCSALEANLQFCPVRACCRLITTVTGQDEQSLRHPDGSNSDTCSVIYIPLPSARKDFTVLYLPVSSKSKTVFFLKGYMKLGKFPEMLNSCSCIIHPNPFVNNLKKKSLADRAVVPSLRSGQQNIS